MKIFVTGRFFGAADNRKSAEADVGLRRCVNFEMID